jgi:hypothetical protein
MKPVWVGIVFFLVYGLLSMKTQAAEVVPIVSIVAADIECR